MDDSLNQLGLNASVLTMRRLFDGIGVASLLFDESGVIDCNQVALSLFKIPEPKVVFRQQFSFLSPTSQSNGKQSHQLFQEYVKLTLQNSVFEFDWQHKRLDGSEFPAHVVFYAVSNDPHKKVIQATVIDNTLLKQTEALLHASHDKYRVVFDTLNSLNILIEEQRIVSCNKTVVKTLHFQNQNQLIGRPVAEIFPETSLSGQTNLSLFNQHCDVALKQGAHKFEWLFRRQDGSIFPAEVSLAVINWDKQTVISAQFDDITDRKELEQELKIAAIAFDLHDGVLVTDQQFNIVRVNRAFSNISGYEPDELVGKNPDFFASTKQGKEFYEAMWAELIATGCWQGQIWSRRKSGDLYAEWLTITHVLTPEGKVTHYIGIYSDMARQGPAETAVYQLAYYDALTNLPNRRLLLDRIEQAMIACKRNLLHGAIIYMDLDNFKELNDTRGHDVGDELLIEFAKRLQLVIREGDTIARMGGDEFVILLENLSEDLVTANHQVQLIAEKLIESIAEPFHFNSVGFKCTSSFGVRLFNQQENSVEDMLKQADLAMYEAKRAGGDSACFFKPQMQAFIDKRAQMQSDLYEAIKRLQLSLNYQIQVDHENGVEGVEVLLRWSHPNQGQIPPGEFILLAEQSDMAFQLGFWVLDTVCQQLQKWQSDPHLAKLIVAVNISVRQFRQTGFVNQLKQLISKYQVDPKLIKLELTEDLLLTDVKGVVAKLSELKSLGIHLSIDDFGAGCSSLFNLKQLPLNQLKIDRSFIENITTDAGDVAIAKSIVDMARNLNLHVIAEGVETQEQASLLEKIGCFSYQGYLYSKPLTLEAFESLLKENFR